MLKKSLYRLLLIGGLITPALQGCTDDPGLRVDTDDSFTGVSLMIPDLKAYATRADGEDLSESDNRALEEGEINHLTILAFQFEGGNYKTTKVFDKPEPIGSQNGNNVYRLNLEPGNYQFCVLANLDNYTDNLSFTTATKPIDVQDIDLSFSKEKPLEAGNLPMVAHMKDITSSNTDQTDNSYITIKAKKSPNITANLKFLCAKVRYTILMDKSTDGFSKALGDDVIDFNCNDSDSKPSASNLRQITNIFSNTDLKDTQKAFIDGSWNINLYRATYPSNGAEYPVYDDTTNPATFEENLTECSDWENTNQRAWQGIVYLPENNNSDVSRTLLNFPWSLNDDPQTEPKQISLVPKSGNSNETDGIERSKFYDLRIKLTSAPETPSLDQSTEIEVSDWTQKSLEYILHGAPYELEVEYSLLDLVQSGYWTTLAFTSDVADEQIRFDSPTISIDGNKVPLFTMEIVKRGDLDDDGMPYEFKEDWSLMRITVNSDIPYKVMRQLNTGSYTDEKDADQKEYKLEDLKYFHIVAGNLHKKIDIDKLNVGAYLIVTPQKITIDAREYYTSGIQTLLKDDPNVDKDQLIKIFFKTNFDSTDDSGLSLTVEDDEKALFKGREFFTYGDIKGYSIQLNKCDGIAENEKEGQPNVYDITSSSGELYFDLRGLLGGSSYWKSKHEYTLTFTLSFPEIDGEEREPIVRKVIVEVKPFSNNYTIRFRDNTKSWEHPHIYIYQLLTLPTDLTKYEPGSNEYESGNHDLHKHAGALIGYIEDNESLGPQYNGAVRYIFTNNLSFRGWWRYGGPKINNPWDPTYGYEKGFLMFGTAVGCQYPTDDKHGTDNDHKQWNFDYAYTEKAPDVKFDRYNFDVNFNEDHEGTNGANIDRWSCDQCKDLYRYHNRNYNYNNNKDKSEPNTRFYPGIAMEKDPDNEGWWKYTLTGVAEPGRTVVFFANWHEPWESEGKNYAAEDNRFPGDYEAATPLFDFADNEGWFEFNGNSGDRNQFFYDEKEDIPFEHIENKFTANMVSNISIDIKKKSHTINSIEVGYQNAWYRQCGLTTGELSALGSTDYTFYQTYYPEIGNLEDKYTLTIDNFNNAVGYRNIIVKIKFDGSDTPFEYILSPKNFKASGRGYVTREPLYLEFEKDIPLYVKWSDKITIDNGWDKHYSYYRPGSDGTDYMELMKNIKGASIGTYEKTGEEIGSYKHVEIKLPEAANGLDGLTFKLAPGSAYFGYLHVSDLPIFYNPYTFNNTYKNGYYLINWHYLDYKDSSHSNQCDQCNYYD